MAIKAGGETLYNVEWNAISLAGQGYGVGSGLAVSVSGGMLTYISSGIAHLYNGKIVSIGSFITHPASSSSGTRMDLISLSGTGAFTLTTGTYASGTALANPPTIATNSVPLAVVQIDSGATTISTANAKDVRGFVMGERPTLEMINNTLNSYTLTHPQSFAWNGNAALTFSSDFQLDAGSSTVAYYTGGIGGTNIIGGSLIDNLVLINAGGGSRWLPTATSGIQNSGTTSDQLAISGPSVSLKFVPNLSGTDWNLHFNSSQSQLGGGGGSAFLYLSSGTTKILLVSGFSSAVVGMNHADLCLVGSFAYLYNPPGTLQASGNMATLGAYRGLELLVTPTAGQSGAIYMDYMTMSTGGEVNTLYSKIKTGTYPVNSAIGYYSGNNLGSVISYVSNDAGVNWYAQSGNNYVNFPTVGSAMKLRLDLVALGSSVPKISNFGMAWTYW